MLLESLPDLLRQFVFVADSNKLAEASIKDLVIVFAFLQNDNAGSNSDSKNKSGAVGYHQCNYCRSVFRIFCSAPPLRTPGTQRLRIPLVESQERICIVNARSALLLVSTPAGESVGH
jgi:hypothetical protein